ncbi:MAG: hypothetical protein ACM3O4_05880 [Ignavibacteriales bacterium]
MNTGNEKAQSNLRHIVDTAMGYYFSPIESILYFYDVVKTRKFANSNKRSSVEELLLNDEEDIICQGYVALLKTFLTEIGILCTEDYIIANNRDDIDNVKTYENHVRLLIRVVDDNYGINGIYAFDPSYDSNISNNRGISSYKFFGTLPSKSDDSRKNINSNLIEFIYERIDVDTNKNKLFKKDLEKFKKLVPEIQDESIDSRDYIIEKLSTNINIEQLMKIISRVKESINEAQEIPRIINQLKMDFFEREEIYNSSVVTEGKRII